MARISRPFGSSRASSDHTARVPAFVEGPSSERTCTGIGSRETPASALESTTVAAARLARAGWIMRTALSPGAGQAFYEGALAGRGRVELYLPCADFEAEARSVREGPGILVLEERGPSTCERSRGCREAGSPVTAGSRQLG